MENIKIEAIKTAVSWWANRLRVITPSNFNMGEGVVGEKCAIIAMSLTLKQLSSHDCIDLFEKRLAEEIEKELENYPNITIVVDYAPDSFLRKLADECHINPMQFPWKTIMQVSCDRVRVQCGYGAKFVTIFPEERDS